MGKKKVFIGVTNVAGVSSRLKKGFDEIGIESDFYSFDKHVFGYKTDKIIEYSDNSFVRKFQKIILLAKLLWKYKYFIYVQPASLFPRFNDVKLFRLFGKKTMLIFTGCDVRIPDVVKKYKWNTCTDCTKEYQDFVGCRVPEKLEITLEAERLFDLISCPMEAGGNLTKPFYPGYFPVDLQRFPKEKFANYQYHDPIRILHAPTNETYKGSKHIYSAIEKLKEKHPGKFIFEVVRNQSIDEFYNSVGNSDIVIDQMLLGSFGFVSIEAMAMYKPVITYMRDDIWDKVKADCPIINANPDNLFEVLENIIQNPAQLTGISSKSREYVEKFWEEKKVAQDYYSLFENISE